jgi:hypothetical protein
MDFRKATLNKKMVSTEDNHHTKDTKDTEDNQDNQLARRHHQLLSNKNKTYGRFYVHPTHKWPDNYVAASKKEWEEYYDPDLRELYASFLDMLNKTHPKNVFDTTRMWGDFKNLIFDTSPQLIPPY